ncbi:hypothetical protein E1295_01025 [Nonomuraea mesophila]|uniref:DUF2569 family protein n=1 Tax=Nonomuraea mesophila TaxID=2530382 RepID=A0A4R5FZF0_9ACTN|nr:hypothetical protein [Nonomuraea mesophila]TDE60448.1 hypothetical protein E1295_01025 [Nonomuraea mesophila]
MVVRLCQEKAVPAPLRLLVPAAIVLVAVYVALPLLMAIDRDFTGASVMRGNPGLDPAHLDFAINAAVTYAVVLHALDVVLVIWFVLKALKGRHWARVALTVYLIVATLAGFVSAAAGSEYYWAVISADVIHLVMIAALWLPASARAFFAAHRRRPDVAERVGEPVS